MLTMPTTALKADAPVPCTASIVNVGSVPQRSPFRYPGGKTWLVPIVRRWLGSLDPRPKTLLEPFAGGATVALTAVFEGFAESATLVELDPDVASVWRTIVAGQGPKLAQMIENFEMTRDGVDAALSAQGQSSLHRAFATIVRNRISRGGILAPGAGIVKSGENGKGLLSRWYPSTLSRRIMAIDARRDRILVEERDGIEAILDVHSQCDIAVFVDPPYTVAGRRLYRYSDIDHERLFAAAAGLAGPLLMTYDHCAPIQRLAEKYRLRTDLVPMKSTHHAQKLELLVSSNLDWLKAQVPHD